MTSWATSTFGAARPRRPPRHTAKLLRVYPAGAYPQFALGFIQETALHDDAAAARNYATVLAQPWNQSSAGAAQNLCRVLIRNGRLDDALTVIQAALGHEPASAGLHYTAAIVWKSRGDLARAQQQLDRYHELVGRSSG